MARRSALGFLPESWLGLGFLPERWLDFWPAPGLLPALLLERWLELEWMRPPGSGP